MKGIYQVRKDNLKPLHREARIVVAQFQCFTINYHADIKRMSSNLVLGVVSIVGEGVKDDLVSPSMPTKVIDGHRCRSLMCGCFLVMVVVVSLVTWLFH
jgi:hypothetical protein